MAEHTVAICTLQAKIKVLEYCSDDVMIFAAAILCITGLAE